MSPYSSEKKEEEGFNSTIVPVANFLPAVREEDADEGRKLAGDTKNEFTQQARRLSSRLREYGSHSVQEFDAVKRKVDKRLLPILAAVYFSQFLDKTSLNYASVMSLPIVGQEYSLVALAFYLGFVVFELPTTALAQRFPLAKYLGCNILLWATSLILHAASPKFPVFFTLRFLLGAFECCVSPILITMVASWYRMNGFTQIFGGLIAWGITFYEGTSIAHWRIIYLLLGGLAYIVGVSVLFWLPDSPATANFLTEQERIIAIERVRDNHSGTVNRTFKRKQAVEALLDPRTWLLLLLVMLMSIPNGGFTNFTSIIIRSFGYTSQEALLLNAPSGAISAITTAAVCSWADAKKTRMMPIFACIVPTVLGAALLVIFDHDREKFKAGCLVGIFLTATFGSALAVMYAWSASNIAGSTKKSVTNGLLMTSFALGNIIGTLIFPITDAPSYTPGKVAVLVLFTSLGVLTLVLRWVNISRNRVKARTLKALIEANDWTPEDVQREADRSAFLDLTDKENPFFFYTP